LLSRRSPYDARLWHPWLRINRVLRAMLERGGVGPGPRRVQEGARAAEIRRAEWFNWQTICTTT